MALMFQVFTWSRRGAPGPQGEADVLVYSEWGRDGTAVEVSAVAKEAEQNEGE